MERIPELADLPVIFISGYGRDETIARALEAGATDYIVKPFSPMELTARIRAALRKQAEPEPYRLGGLAIHYEERRVSVADRPVELTATEYELLRVLSRNAGRVSTHEALLRQVWGVTPQWRYGTGAHLREEPPLQARRRRGQPGLHRQRARGRLPHGTAGRRVRAERAVLSSASPTACGVTAAPVWIPAVVAPALVAPALVRYDPDR